ncbi:MAG: LiaF-related protein [Spirochaetia bacterium]|nr:LiaF-related protein [Spirochaetia bacterium]
MWFLFSGAFWGVFLIIVGLTILLRVFFNIDLPIIRIFFGLFIIAVGISVLTGKGWQFKDASNTIFSENTFIAEGNEKKYNVIFSKGKIDLTNIKITNVNLEIEINSIFAENKILIDNEIPMHIKINSAFAGVFTPDGSITSFGSFNYSNKKYDKSKPYLKVIVNSVFASVKIKEKN